jgi:hypothetical protein
MFLDVGAYLKIAATVAVALLAFGAMTSPAWAQDTTLGLRTTPLTGNLPIGQEATFKVTVSTLGMGAEGVTLEDVFLLQDVQLAPSSFSVSTTQGTCDFISDNSEPPLPTTYVVACQLGDLSDFDEAVVTIKLVPTTSGTISYQATVQANNVQPESAFGQVTVVDPGEDNGERVLVDHKGKELCLPKAALNGHLNHGDEVISEEGCSNASSTKNGKSGRDGGARSKAL